jgi:hypothetical protein
MDSTMPLEAPKPVKGTLTRKLEDGTTETIEMTVAEVKDAPTKYNHHDCTNIVVDFDDGTQARPYRCVDTEPNVRFEIINGRRVCYC